MAVDAFVFYTEIALGATLTGPPTSWSWTDVTDYVGGNEISITRGRADRYTEARPDTCALTFLNNGGRFVPKNALSPYYGRLRRNTPLRVMVQPLVNSASDTFSRTVSNGWGTADSGGAWTAAGTASDFSVASASGGRHTNTTTAASHFTTLPFSLNRVDVKLRIRVNALSTGDVQQAGVAVRFTDSNNTQRAELIFAVGGAITVRLVSRVAGADTPGSSFSTGLTHSAAAWYWLRLQTGLTSARAKVWLDGTTEPSTWTIDGSAGVMSVTTAGQVGCFTRRNAGNTNVNATTDFEDFTLVDGPRIEFTGFVDGWPVTWADGALTQSYAPITASGQLRRLAEVQPLRSAIYRACTSDSILASSAVVAYWPMEDGSSTTMFASAIGGLAQGFTGMRPASDSQVVGSDALPTLDGTGSFRFTVPSYAASTTWSVCWAMRIPASSISGNAQVMSWGTPGGSPVIRWQLTLIPGAPDAFRLEGYNWDAVPLAISATVNAVDSTSGAELTNGRQLYFLATGTQSGGNTTVTMNCYFVPDDGSSPSALVTTSVTTANTNNNVNLVYHDAPNGFANGGHTIGHVLVGTTTTVGAGVIGVTGGAGDLVSTRFSALLAEQGIVGYFGDLIRGVGTTTQQAGPQRSRTVTAELLEQEDTEGGVLSDGKQGLVQLLPRAFLLNRPVDLTLDVNAGHVGWPFTAAEDDFLLRNDILVSNANASAARSFDKTSIDLDGVHGDQVQVNAYRDTGLQDMADWRRYAGTAGGLRYPAIALNLTGQHLALASTWCDTDIGSRIQVTNVPSNELPPENLDLIVYGYTTTISSTEWTAVVNAGPYRGAGVWDGGKRWDCAACTLAEDLDTTETGIDVAIADTCTWTHAGGDFDIFVGGERMTVTNVTAAAGAGSAWTQTLTVVRSVNGVVKTHSTNAAVHIADPFIWGF